MAAVASLRTAPLGTVDVLREIDGLLDRVHAGDVCGGPAAATALGAVDRVITRLQAVRLSLVGGGRGLWTHGDVGLVGG